MPGSSQRLAFLPAFFILTFFLAVLEASEITVSPVRVRIDYEKKTTTLNLTNKFEKRILFHMESFLWTQDQGADQLSPTKDIMAMPPIFTIEPGKSQVIRIIFRGSKSQTQELTYRIIITEVPDETVRVVGGVRTNLRLSIPVFVKPKVRSKPQIEWSLQKMNEKDLRLVLKNTGNAHILLGTLKLFSEKEQENPFYETTLSGYVLPGQSRSWSLNLAQPISHPDVFLRVDTNDGKKEMQLTIQ